MPPTRTGMQRHDIPLHAGKEARQLCSTRNHDPCLAKTRKFGQTPRCNSRIVALTIRRASAKRKHLVGWRNPLRRARLCPTWRSGMASRSTEMPRCISARSWEPARRRRTAPARFIPQRAIGKDSDQEVIEADFGAAFGRPAGQAGRPRAPADLRGAAGPRCTGVGTRAHLHAREQEQNGNIGQLASGFNPSLDTKTDGEVPSEGRGPAASRSHWERHRRVLSVSHWPKDWIAGPEGWDKDVLDVASEALTVDRSLELSREPRCGHGAARQARWLSSTGGAAQSAGKRISARPRRSEWPRGLRDRGGSGARIRPARRTLEQADTLPSTDHTQGCPGARLGGTRPDPPVYLLAAHFLSMFWAISVPFRKVLAFMTVLEASTVIAPVCVQDPSSLCFHASQGILDKSPGQLWMV
jgi:hypothetical protein